MKIRRRNREEWLDLINRVKPSPLLWKLLAAAVCQKAITEEEAMSVARFWGAAAHSVFWGHIYPPDGRAA